MPLYIVERFSKDKMDKKKCANITRTDKKVFAKSILCYLRKILDSIYFDVIKYFSSTVVKITLYFTIHRKC